MTNPVQELFDAAVRVECLIYIPSAAADPEITPECFREDFCEALPERADAPLYEQLPPMAQFADSEEWPEPEVVAFALFRTPGFLVQAATPVRDEGGSYSWGHYWTEWLYAATETDIARVSLEWAATKRAPALVSEPSQS